MLLQISTSSVPTNTLRSQARTANLLGAAFAFLVIAGGVLGYGIGSADATAGQILKLVTSDGGSTFYIGRCFRTDIRLQTDNLNANSVDVILTYNSSYLQPYTGSGCTTAATAIQTDGLFGSYPSNTIGGGQVEVTAYDATGTNPVNTGAAPTDKLLGHIYWKVIAASGSYVIPFQFTPGSTLDSNVAQQGGDGSDTLDSVENLTLNLSADTTAPTFSSLSPADSATDVSVTTGITYTFADAGAGVGTGTLTHSLNRTTKNKTYSSCVRTNSNRVASCSITMSSVGTLSYNTLYRVHATGSDVASPSANTGNQVWTFTTEDDDDAPYLSSVSPANNATGVAVNSNISFHVKDYKNQAGVTAGLGVDISTVSVTVTQSGSSPITYTSASPQFSYTGTSADYTITINPSSDFDQNKVVSFTIDASDLHSPANAMSTATYSFTTTDSTAPTISNFSPSQGATGVSPDANVSFTITDAGAGVSLANTSVTVDGTAYTSASPYFSYTSVSSGYTITINPPSNFTGGETISVSISTQDQATTPNTASASYSFTIENGCSTCSVDTEDPARFTTSATLDETISFHVKDTGAGIDSDTINVTLVGTGSAFTTNPLVLTGASALTSITGTSADYTFTITLPAAIQENYTYSILIQANDVDGRAMSQVAYTFMNLVTTGSGTTTTIVTNICPDSTTTTAVRTSGNSRRTTSMLENILPENLPTILSRRRLPNSDTIVTEALSPEDARNVRICYVDDLPLHAAAKTKYTDVPEGAWYEDAVKAFLDLGILDATQTTFRPGASAVRAELAKVLGGLNGTVPERWTKPMQFDDLEKDAWYVPFVEFAAQEGWMKGYNNCIGSHPCQVMPASTISRAEAVAMVVRYYDMKPIGIAPAFADVPASSWYVSAMQAAADHCVIQGDTEGLAKPSELLNRAQMIVLLYRAKQNLAFGLDCHDNRKAASSSSSIARSANISSVPRTSSAPAAILSSSQSSSSLLSSFSSQNFSSSTQASLQASVPTDHTDPTLPIAGVLVVVTMVGMAGRLFFAAESAFI